ncbi:MAG TPA: GH25 family lysozyme [Longimicrobium sp.]|nr:GH25 family lysozyme [Longimicrobium sp.]
MPFVRSKLASVVLLAVALPAVLACGRGDEAASVPSRATSAEAARDTVRAPARTDAPAAADERLPARGIDVSHYQGRVDWRAVEEAGIGFAFLKATEGVTFTDPTFRAHWAALGETRILRGAYHRFRAGRDAAAQAEHFLAVARLGEGDLPAVLDVETTDGVSDARLIRGARTWLEAVERRTGARPIVYTRPGFRRTHLGRALDDYPLWIAEYNVDSPSTGTWSFWQHSQQGRVAGIQNIVDLDHFNGSLAELRKLAVPTK